MKRILLISACVAGLIAGLSGCARYDAARACQKEAGEQPNQLANAFGAIGGIINSQTPEMQAYAKSVDDCMARYDQAQTQTQAPAQNHKSSPSSAAQ